MSTPKLVEENRSNLIGIRAYLSLIELYFLNPQ
jgi:hypothetical protein